MAYELAPGVPLDDAVRAVVTSEVDAALASLARVHAAGDPAAVHDVRKRTKKLRALVTALSGTVPRRRWRAASRAAAEAARTLAGSRDAEVRLVTLTALVADRQAEFADALAHAAAEARTALAPDVEAHTSTPLGDDEQVQHASWLLTGVAAEVASWRLPDRFSSLAGGVGDTYRDGRRRWRVLAAAAADGGYLDTEDLHRWRRAVKYRWYHTRLLAPIAPDVLGAEGVLLDEAGESLGVDHDLAVLVSTMTSDPGAWGGAEVVAEVGRLAADRQADLQSRALDLGRQLYALPTRIHLDRLGGWWRGVPPRPVPPR